MGSDPVEWYRIYEIEAGFVVADQAGWRDGVFDTIEEARASIAVDRGDQSCAS